MDNTKSETDMKPSEDKLILQLDFRSGNALNTFIHAELPIVSGTEIKKLCVKLVKICERYKAIRSMPPKNRNGTQF